MPFQRLPTFKGYTVDIRLKQFRKVTKHKIQFIKFNSIEGEKILLKYIKRLDRTKK